jgi:hypothetical protein
LEEEYAKLMQVSSQRFMLRFSKLKFLARFCKLRSQTFIGKLSQKACWILQGAVKRFIQLEAAPLSIKNALKLQKFVD